MKGIHMETNLQGRFSLTLEEEETLRRLGVKDPIFDPIPDSVFDSLEAAIVELESDEDRGAVEELLVKLTMES